MGGLIPIGGGADAEIKGRLAGKLAVATPLPKSRP
jgi:hypothetical protein